MGFYVEKMQLRYKYPSQMILKVIFHLAILVEALIFGIFIPELIKPSEGSYPT